MKDMKSILFLCSKQFNPQLAKTLFPGVQEKSGRFSKKEELGVPLM